MNGRPVVITHDLTKRYQRTGPPALDSLNLRIPKGALYGFVGPNGAGKTTTLRMLAGLLAPTSGEVLIRGHSMNVSPRIVRNYVGIISISWGNVGRIGNPTYSCPCFLRRYSLDLPSSMVRHAC